MVVAACLLLVSWGVYAQTASGGRRQVTSRTRTVSEEEARREQHPQEVEIQEFTLADGELQMDTTAVQSVGRKKDGTRIYADTAIYQGMNLKLDLGTTLIELGTSRGQVQSYEIAMNWRLKQRYFPTLELGYARASAETASADHWGQGGFARVGLDFNGLKKHPENPNVLLVGLRLGTAVQQYDMTNVSMNSPYWGDTRRDYMGLIGADCWGEVVAGCQVQVWEGLQMGWYIRLKVLFTRNAKEDSVLPMYIPGFGYRDDTNWGINYYIGYWF